MEEDRRAQPRSSDNRRERQHSTLSEVYLRHLQHQPHHLPHQAGAQGRTSPCSSGPKPASRTPLGPTDRRLRVSHRVAGPGSRCRRHRRDQSRGSDIMCSGGGGGPAPANNTPAPAPAAPMAAAPIQAPPPATPAGGNDPSSAGYRGFTEPTSVRTARKRPTSAAGGSGTSVPVSGGSGLTM